MRTKILKILPTEKQTFLIEFVQGTIKKTVETRAFESLGFQELKKEGKRFWQKYLKHGVYRTLEMKIEY